MKDKIDYLLYDLQNASIVRLENWRYLVNFGCGKDEWRLSGNVFNHPTIDDGNQAFVSTPVYFDKSKMITITASGRVYSLGICAGNLEEQMGYILDDIKNKGTIHL